MSSLSATTHSSSVRWRLVFVLAVTMFVNWLDRSAMSYALVPIGRELGWTEAQLGEYGGYLLAVFFIGYGLTQLLLSARAERWSPVRSLTLGITAFSLLTALNAPLGVSLTALLVLRFLLGVGEGVHIPMLSALTARWFAPGERSRANTIWINGLQVAIIAAPLLTVPVIAAFGWRAMFVLIGVLGLLVSLPLLRRFVRDWPPGGEGHEDGVEGVPLPELLPGRAYWRRPLFWTITLVGILSNFTVFGFLSWLPTYFTEVKGLPLGTELAVASALPNVALVLGTVLFSALGDRTNRRTLLAGAGYLGVAVALYFAVRVPGLWLTVAFFTLGTFAQSAFQAQEYALVQRVLPVTQAGAGVGLYNGLGVLVGGTLGVIAVGQLASASGSFSTGMLLLILTAALPALILFALAPKLRY